MIQEQATLLPLAFRLHVMVEYIQHNNGARDLVLMHMFLYTKKQ